MMRTVLLRCLWMVPLCAIAHDGEHSVAVIPNSQLSVEFPKDWACSVSPGYVGSEKFALLVINLPAEGGSTPSFPQFEIEFVGKDLRPRGVKTLEKTALIPLEISGHAAGRFTEPSQVSYLNSDFSHSEATVWVGGYVVTLGDGKLTCTLTAMTQESLGEYSDSLLEMCESAVRSAGLRERSEEKGFRQCG